MDNFPLTPLLDAMRTLIGRIFVFFVVVITFSGIGAATGSRYLGDLVGGVIGFPLVCFNSIFYSYGLLVLPLLFLFVIGFVVYEWPLRFLIVPAVLMWLIAHDSTHFITYESATAKMMKELQVIIESETIEDNEAKQSSSANPLPPEAPEDP